MSIRQQGGVAGISYQVESVCCGISGFSPLEMEAHSKAAHASEEPGDSATNKEKFRSDKL
jgi:hypothetical protein